jgi:putative flippase GtrA
MGGMSGRLRRFFVVGAAGCVVQLAAVAVLNLAMGWPPAAATGFGVELAVLHNFFWHERWTWNDRTPTGEGGSRRLLRFHLTTGVVSLAGNVLLVLLAARVLGVGSVLANALAVAAMSLLNFLAADRYVFTPVQAAFIVLPLVLAPVPAAATELTPPTLEAWSEYVSRTEAALPGRSELDRPMEPAGREIPIPGGLIHDWHGSVFIPGITVRQLIDALVNPGTPPPQDDVAESRVISRDGDRLRVYLKLVRTALITVSYDTEHEVTFERQGSQSATSRSIATTISEAGGDDHGFLWRLNSYWRYRQTGGGVEVEVTSLSLSRSVPLLLRPVAGPLVNRIARESMVRTLDAVRRFGEALRLREPGSHSAGSANGDSGLLHLLAQPRREQGGARRIAVNADGLGPHLDRRAIDCRHRSPQHHVQRATRHLAFVFDRRARPAPWDQ